MYSLIGLYAPLLSSFEPKSGASTIVTSPANPSSFNVMWVSVTVTCFSCRFVTGTPSSSTSSLNKAFANVRFPSPGVPTSMRLNLNPSSCRWRAISPSVAFWKPRLLVELRARASYVGRGAQSSNLGFQKATEGEMARHLQEEGFKFNLMLVGTPGLGKRTFAKALFKLEVLDEGVPVTNLQEKQVTVTETHITLNEDGFAGDVTIVEAPDFGSKLDNSGAYKPIREYITNQYNTYMEKLMTEVRIADTRVHVLLYFLEPTGRPLRPIDIEFLKNIYDVVNVVPVISKRDSMTDPEVAAYKKLILENLSEHGINILRFPESSETVFSVVASTHRPPPAEKRNLTAITRVEQLLKEIKQAKLDGREGSYVTGMLESCSALMKTGIEDTDTEGKPNRGRDYPWGTLDIERGDFSDFPLLRSMMLLRKRIFLTRTTHEDLFQSYRLQRLAATGQISADPEAIRRQEEALKQKLDAERRRLEEEKKKSDAEAQRALEQNRILAAKLAEMEKALAAQRQS
eukprot:TRINITY_DN2673_c0_g1_i1.p1 TRINITY_DN2673_c0_g1~~TRINITY_DN2673_c0_g1_i1.p1  ORF type:complete len:515 (-),score=108.20 TRINITY_DN2673_c0_g1_i1:138-1682(-)